MLVFPCLYNDGKKVSKVSCLTVNITVFCNGFGEILTSLRDCIDWPKSNIYQLQEPQPQYDEPKEDYEADFESEEYYENIAGDDEEEESPGDEEAREAADQRQAWLMEQAERGRARQKALMNRIEDQSSSPGPGSGLQSGLGRQRTFQEKESSRDSAYGYSADSRIPTREPTPDYR